ncbi:MULTISPECIES: Panacea domain-containing protein [Acinetobacter]|uniref:Panacea domain-containing protein n=1 Tax=Acinetobacter TaxID=469 RepID=UPI002578CD17|nr:type II toxin-antitoxin system antitoxin SocA domain-containing protein [Acinetobacter indicus]MDM1771571.1 DUF4065 domain-containing protein [Acinetobacter indicus]MDM1774369.1 DUF4065 domain-containing protein [Acinetobacter indicus]
MKALNLANYIICEAIEKYPQYPITHLKLQKILYYIVATYFANNTDACEFFTDNEKIEKWQFGPVLPSVYNEFKTYGGRAITMPSTEIEFSLVEDEDTDFIIKEFDKENFEGNNPSIISLAQNVISKLINKDAFELVEMTHQEPAWSNYESIIKSGGRGLTYSIEELRSATKII